MLLHKCIFCIPQCVSVCTTNLWRWDASLYGAQQTSLRMRTFFRILTLNGQQSSHNTGFNFPSFSPFTSSFLKSELHLDQLKPSADLSLCLFMLFFSWNKPITFLSSFLHGIVCLYFWGWDQTKAWQTTPHSGFFEYCFMISFNCFFSTYLYICPAYQNFALKFKFNFLIRVSQNTVDVEHFFMSSQETGNGVLTCAAVWPLG